MQLDKNNLYVRKHKTGFSIFIEMPDNSRNYLHSKPINEINDAVAAKIMMEGLELNYDNTKIVKDRDYLRIVSTINIGKLNIRFHSRLLNDLDAQREYELLVYE